VKSARSSISSQVARSIAFLFGVGLSPVAPGTLATVAAVPLVVFLATLGPLLYAAVTIVMMVTAIWLAGQVERELGVVDPSAIVIDEVIGFIVAMAFLPMEYLVLVAAFALFRFFDICKPPPIGWIERRFAGGFAIVIDDVVAGLMTNVIIQISLVAIGMT
jgi:phosphatidylglycerophosphatase A